MTQARYSSTAIFLHWAIALALAFQLGLGLRLEHIPKGPGLFAAYQLHKSVGIAILLLTFARIAIRLIRKPPPLMADSVWALWAARIVHWAFYGIMLIGPITGWILVSTARVKVPTLLFGVVPWPHLPVPHSWHEPSEGIHEVVAKLLFLLFALHVGGALRHQFLKHENILGRMVPFLTSRSITPLKAALVALAAVCAMWVAHGAGWQWPFPNAAPAPAVAPAGETANVAAAVPEAKPVETAETKPDEKEAAAKAPQSLASWAVAPGGRLGFTASWSGSPVTGSFKRWDAAIKFTPDDLAKTAIRVTIDLATVGTGDSQRDESLKSSDFFGVSAHPKAIFSASGAKALGGDRYQSSGTLDLHGTKKPVTLAYTLKIANDVARVSGATSLDRTAFSVGSGEWAATDQIAGKVGVSFNFTAKRKATG